MLRLLSLCLLLLALPCAAAGAAPGPEPAGTVVRLQGAALVNHASTSANLALHDTIVAGDRIVTGRNTRVLLRMVDGSMLTLGENTEFAINAYRYSPGAGEGSARLELIKGVFRAVTGAIGKLPARDFTVKTATATIGIRGTDFWGGFLFSQALDVTLLGGAGIYVENAAGRVEISEHGVGTTVSAVDQAPSTPIRWGRDKLNAAVQSVAIEP